MIVTNTETIVGYEIIEMKGLVQGNTVRTKHAGRDIAAGLKNLVGGELKGYTELLTESRREAMQRMLAQAQQLGADGVVNVRFTTSDKLEICACAQHKHVHACWETIWYSIKRWIHSSRR